MYNDDMADNHEALIENLEAQVADRTEALRKSNEELQQFAYVVSHDLQEPLRAISGYLQLLERRHKENLPEDAQNCIHRSAAAATRMHDLIKALLSYSRVESKGQPFQPVNTKQVIDQALEFLQSQIEEKNATVELGSLPVVWGDQAQILQLFQNLVSNAIKFHDEQPPLIHITSEESSKKPGYITFSVQDNGIGIQPKDKDRIFLIFQRLHTRDEYPGTGIGLAVCKKIIERHGGSIWFESSTANLSTIDTGTTFKFTLPANKAHQDKVHE
jgi:light-regulated signal transduction histidine kinase (bacteriophytochrome)